MNLWQAFLDRYYPYTANPATSATAKDDAKAAAGTYTLSRRSETSFLKNCFLARAVHSVAGWRWRHRNTATNRRERQTETLAGCWSDDVSRARWSGQTRLQTGSEWHMQMVLPYPFFVGQRVGTLQNGKLLLAVLGISLVLMLLTLILWPVAWFVRRHYGTSWN